jgi:hypothetical protein
VEVAVEGAGDPTLVRAGIPGLTDMLPLHGSLHRDQQQHSDVIVMLQTVLKKK